MSMLDELRRFAGLPEEAASAVRIHDAGPTLRTPYRVAECGSAAVGAAAMAAAWLWALRGERRQDVGINSIAATAAMQSYKYMRIDGSPPGAVMEKLTGFYRVRDERWIYLHCNFPNLAARNCEVLGAQATPESLRAKAAGFDGEALEDALARAGGCGTLVRTEAEWLAHPQGMAAAAEAPLEITRIADAPREPLRDGPRPLSGVRVLDLTRVLAGPTCGKTLGEHGADVLRIVGPGLANSGVLDLDTGLGKLSACLDLRVPSQAERLRELAAGCDVFSQAYRPGSLAQRGFSPQALAAARPGIVLISLNAWGHSGPWSERRGYDTVVQAANGMALASGADRPAGMPVALQDYVAGYLMASGAMAALARRVTEGGSWHVRVSLAACGEWIRRQGRLPHEQWRHGPEQLPSSIVAPWLAQSPSPAGLLTHLGSVTAMSLTPARWDRPLVADGASPAEWPGAPHRAPSCSSCH